MRVMPTMRRLVARRPWIQWVAIGSLGLGVAASVADAMAGLEAERIAWGEPVTVWVATADVPVGGPIVAETVEVPEAVRPADAIRELPDGSRARQVIGRGETLVRHDVWGAEDELGLAPPGWLVAPVEETPPSGARIGERVQVASDGFVIAPDGVVIDVERDGVTLVAVPAEVAPLLPMASTTDGVTLLRAP